MRSSQLVAALLLSFAAFSSFSQALETKPSFPNAAAAIELIPDDVAPPIVPLTPSPNASDFTGLRETFGRRKDFLKRCELGRPLKQWVELGQAKNHRYAYLVMFQWLLQCPVDGRGHLMAISSLNDLGNTISLEVHKQWVDGLAQSIFKTGDGRTPQTAYETISVSEEYSVLSVLGLKRIRQETVQGGASPLDLLVTEPLNGGGQQSSIYFNPRLHFLRLASEFSNIKQPAAPTKP